MPDPQDRPLSTPGRRPYGATAEERRVLRLGAAMRDRGCTWQQIADELTARCEVRRNGTPWTAANLAQILRRYSSDSSGG